MDSTLAALYEMAVGDALGQVPLPVQVLVAVLLVGTAAWAGRRPRALPAIAFAACALMWSRANQRLEGPVLWTLSPGHGLVAADLLPVVLLAAVLARVALLRRARRRAAVAADDAAAVVPPVPRPRTEPAPSRPRSRAAARDT